MTEGEGSWKVMPLLTRAQVESAVKVANVPALLMTIYQFTGDRAWLAEEFRPTRGRGLDDNDSGGLPGQVQARIRGAAADAILRMQRGEKPVIDIPPSEEMVDMMAFYIGEQVALEYGGMLATEFARRSGQLRQGQHRAPNSDGFRVAIIGAGVGGIAAARQCQEDGIDFMLLEQAMGPGGVWWKNAYPGAGVDTPSHLYSLSFARHSWSTHFAMQGEIQDYLARVLDEVVARGADVRFGVEVMRMQWDAASTSWHLAVRTGNSEGSLEVDAVICCVGGLNIPFIPQVPGMKDFSGETFHSAEWPDGLDLLGKRVAVVGTGASAMQIVPAIAGSVAHLAVVQRSPQWVAPFPKFRRDIPRDLQALLDACPIYYGWYWLRLFWQFGDNVLQALHKDPAWPHPERSVNGRNDGHRRFFTRYIKQCLADRQELLPLVLPDYPPFGKRILLDNGWYETLRRPNVSLIAKPVVAMDREGILTPEGRYDADIVVWATGFETSRFVSSIEVIGAGGRSLREVWADDDPRAYLGVSVPDFPNFFMLGGPNSFPGSGSIMFWLELQANYVCRILNRMRHDRISAAWIKKEIHDTYNEVIDEQHEHMIWTHPGMRTYYRNDRGRVVFVSPFRNVDFWHMLRAADLSEYNTQQAQMTISEMQEQKETA